MSIEKVNNIFVDDESKNLTEKYDPENFEITYFGNNPKTPFSGDGTLGNVAYEVMAGIFIHEAKKHQAYVGMSFEDIPDSGRFGMISNGYLRVADIEGTEVAFLTEKALSQIKEVQVANLKVSIPAQQKRLEALEGI